MDDINVHYLERAIELSRQGMLGHQGGPFGCVVVKGSRIIGEGCNRVTADNDPTAHAEIVAIRAACATLGNFQLTGCDVYSSCEPCPMCLGAIYWARFRKVYYGNTKQDAAAIGFDDHFIYEQLDKPLARRSIPMEQLLPEEAKIAFQEWQAHPNKMIY